MAGSGVTVTSSEFPELEGCLAEVDLYVNNEVEFVSDTGLIVAGGTEDDPDTVSGGGGGCACVVVVFHDFEPANLTRGYGLPLDYVLLCLSIYSRRVLCLSTQLPRTREDCRDSRPQLLNI